MTSMRAYRTHPLDDRTLPGGIPFIIANEAAERFSFYGMRAILVVFMTQYLVTASGHDDHMSDDEAKGWFHLFVSAVYFTPLIGALISDGILGKYRTIITLSIIYTLGHFALAIDDTRLGLAIGLGLIAFGAGGIKPCVSAHLGDQFSRASSHLLPRTFGWFYFAINLGAFSSTLFIPWVLETHGAATAFAIPGILMLLATAIFWSGRYRFVHIPPTGTHFIRDVFSLEGRQTLLRLSLLYLFVAMFWALFDQTASSWVLQAQQMDRDLFGFELLPSQLQAANPLLVMLLIPLFSYLVYPLLSRVITLTPLRKISIGMFITVLAFGVSALIQQQLDSGQQPDIIWQLLAYVLLTSAEIMISITCLEYSYTQAPVRMKSFIMAFFMLSIAVGNLFTSAVNFFIENDDGSSKLAGADYFWFFTILMLLTAILFSVLFRNSNEKDHLQATH